MCHGPFSQHSNLFLHTLRRTTRTTSRMDSCSVLIVHHRAQHKGTAHMFPVWVSRRSSSFSELRGKQQVDCSGIVCQFLVCLGAHVWSTVHHLIAPLLGHLLALRRTAACKFSSGLLYSYCHTFIFCNCSRNSCENVSICCGSARNRSTCKSRCKVYDPILTEENRSVGQPRPLLGRLVKVGI